MAKIAAANTMIEHRTETRPGRPDVASLSPSVRRHLGKSLRSLYAHTLSEPVSGQVSERLDALLAKLEAEPKA